MRIFAPAAMTMSTSHVDSFIQRWAASGAAERANYQLFLTELCTLLEVPPPEPTRPDDADNAYVFERSVHFQEDDGSTSIGRIDLYKRACFVLEAKQGSDAQAADAEEAAALMPGKAKRAKRRGTAVRGTAEWDDAMVRARGQADRYARALPAAEGWPPFLVVVDVGHSIELYSEFGRSGRTYVPFPDPKSFRILLADLRRPEIRERLRQVWLDPLSLDPSRRSAKVTRQLAERLAELAKLLEKAGHHAEDVARFLMRCLFTMFAEDVELIPAGSFKDLLGGLLDEPDNFKPMVEDLWRTMNTGGFSPVFRKKLLRFNGGLFAENFALPLTRPMLELLHEAAEADWTDVEPAIFGTLLERALDPVERHKLGAHYTPRAYVERLVLPTVIEPLREEWQAAYAGALSAARRGKLADAQETVRAFHEHLCKTRVLDPACGSGNFLYVTLEQMKRLEGEVLNALREFGEAQQILFEVDPHQFLGIEVNPRAAAIADLVLWIGYLQWHFRTRGHAAPAEPIIKNYKNIECRDAVLAWDRKEPVLDKDLKPVTRWDGRTMKKHPVTGEDVPDESARTLVERYINPRKAEWPKAEYVVGNPPFIGNKRMVLNLGHGYVDALRRAHDDVSEAADFVMYWWDHAAALIRSGAVRRSGLITTNSITQTFNRGVVRKHLDGENGVALVFAVPDHPWVESSDGAAVRISMTVIAEKIRHVQPLLVTVTSETDSDDPERDGTLLTLSVSKCAQINPDLTSGCNVTDCLTLRSNLGLSNQGVTPLGEGFRLTRDELRSLGYVPGKLPPVIKRYSIGRDLVRSAEERFIIDLFGIDQHDAQRRYPDLMQIVTDRVKPERDQKNRDAYREKWWVFAEPRANLRPAISSVPWYIATCRTAKHRVFVRLESDILPDAKIVAIGLSDFYCLGVLSSRLHVAWAMLTGGWLGVGNDSNYNHSDCFAKFPFPACDAAQQTRIREIGEQLDAHRKRQQGLHPKLTLTDMYNVLEKLRAGEELTAKEKVVHEQGLVSVLRQIHDDLDAAVFAAYGWPVTLSDDEILERLVALNAERAAEEARGLVRWLRPEFQNPGGAGAKQQTLSLAEADEDEGERETKRGKRKGSRKGGTPRVFDGRGLGVEEPSHAVGRASGRATPSPSPLTPLPERQRGTTTAPSAGAKHPWPKGRAAQAKAVLAVLRDCPVPVTSEELAQRFARAHRETIDELLQALVALGQARRTRGGKYAC